ncbi:hypothetical protein SK803_41690 [Lentzea sp. BCCO 10_0856]|uniref:Uncharacterized protein n=1 Tax=Lentzea miocenica TaxID=3095431 RepID=A0ABU4TEZ7_9PSEU|nr:hypothetical protein [Lentzea sp. BCCO 10_0856]MDX8036748.1 hypothetical protein [Lentzea sp. BCCO 10_0856]
MTVAAFVISCFGLLVACLAAWYGRGQKRAAEKSADEAKRSADAAVALAEVEAARRADELTESERGRVRFALEHERGQRYLLRNVGTDSAYGVHVDTGGLGVQGEVTDFEEFEAESEHRYLLAKTFNGNQADHVLVTWHLTEDRSDKPRSVKLLGP